MTVPSGGPSRNVQCIGWDWQIRGALVRYSTAVSEGIMCMLGYRLRETRCMWGSYHNCDKVRVGGYRSWGNRYRKLLGSHQLARDACGRVIHIERLIAKCNQLWEGMSKLGSNQARKLGCDGSRQGESNEGWRCSVNATLRGRFLIRYPIST